MLAMPQPLQIVQFVCVCQSSPDTPGNRPGCTRTPGDTPPRLRRSSSMPSTADVILVEVVAARHLTRVAAEGDLDYGVDQVEWDACPPRCVPDLLLRYDLFGREDQPPGSVGQLEVFDQGAVDLRVAVAVAAGDVDDRNIGIARRQQADRLAGRWVGHDPGRAVLEGVGAQQAARLGMKGSPIAAARKRHW